MGVGWGDMQLKEAEDKDKAEMEAARAAASKAAQADAVATIKAHTQGGTFFCAPLQLVAGAPAVLYFNRAYSNLAPSNRRETALTVSIGRCRQPVTSPRLLMPTLKRRFLGSLYHKM